ncbi:MAG: hypothetical protein EOO46_01315 [Flavobacterium sp.]|nr:MAG: hypothetical protein EOO46_01315 [Flavobacterium sp.]
MQHSVKFICDLKNSQQKEKAFLIALLGKGLTGETTEHLDNFNAYDVSATGSTGKVSTYEIKCNTSGWTAKTFIELSKVKNGTKQDAGLSATKADYYVFTFQYNPKFYIIRTKKLRELKYEHIYTDTGGYQLGIILTDTLLSLCDAVI